MLISFLLRTFQCPERDLLNMCCLYLYQWNLYPICKSLTRKTGLTYLLDLSILLISSKSRNLVERKMTFAIRTSFDSFCSQWLHSDYDMNY